MQHLFASLSEGTACTADQVAELFRRSIASLSDRITASDDPVQRLVNDKALLSSEVILEVLIPLERMRTHRSISPIAF